MYFLLGALLVGVQLYIRSILKKYETTGLWKRCVLIFLANAMIIFSFAWTYASILEHEMQAAMMGLIFFGGFGAVIAIIAYRVALK